MNTVTVRRVNDGTLVAFGPNNGMYDPGVADGQVKALEDDYDVILAEWNAAQPPPPQVHAFEGTLKAIYANDLTALNTLMAKYPLFLWSLRDGNWTYVRDMFVTAVASGDIAPARWVQIQAAATEKHIPIV